MERFIYDIDVPSLDEEASLSVDALVADDAADMIHGSIAVDHIGSRSSTPAHPPGLALPHAHPSPEMRGETMIKLSSRIVPTSAAFTPSRSTSSAYIPRVATPLTTVSTPVSPTQQLALPRTAETLETKAKQDIRSAASASGLSKTIAKQSNQFVQSSFLDDDDFPTLDKGKAKEIIPSSGTKSSQLYKKTTSTALPALPPMPALHNSKIKGQAITLNTAGAIPSSSPKAGLASENTTKSASASAVSASSAAFPPLPPSTPTAARNPPKPLRLVPTPKTETLPAGASALAFTASAVTPVFPPTRQPSLASIKLDRPGTPVSVGEAISDIASIASTSFSRPSSPPPSRIGSAPVRSTTKSQQKKQRREAMKEKEKSELDTVVDQPEPEVEVAPILGRKKKQKKEKVRNTNTTNLSTPAVSRPASPTMPSRSASIKETKQKDTGKENEKEKEKEAGKPDKSSNGEFTFTFKVPEREPDKQPPAPTVETVDPEETAEKPIPTPHLALLDLQAKSMLLDPENLALLKFPVGLNHKIDNLADAQDFDSRLLITDEDREALRAGKPVHKVTAGSGRIMLTPNGDCVRNLTPAEEERYIQLQERIQGDAGPGAFVPARYTANSGFTLIGGRAVPNGPPAFLPPVDSNSISGHMDAVQRIQRDEALSYINQFVLPSLSTNTQLERALNANALDTEMLRPHDSQGWGGWGVGLGHTDVLGSQNDPHAAVETPYGPSSNDGILATGLESMTAHFAVGRENGRGQPLGNVTLLSLSESESAMQAAKKETEKLEKSLNNLLKRNRKLLLSAHYNH